MLMSLCFSRAYFPGIVLDQVSKIAYGVFKKGPATYEAISILERTTDQFQVLFVVIGIIIVGPDFHNSVVGQEAVPLSRISMLPDKLQDDFSVLLAGWVSFFLDLPFHCIYIRLPDTAIGLGRASNSGRRLISTISGLVCCCGVRLILTFKKIG